MLAERLIVAAQHRVTLGVELQPLHQHAAEECHRHRHDEDQGLEDPTGLGGIARHGRYDSKGPLGEKPRAARLILG